MDIAITPITELVKYLGPFVRRHICYMVDPNRYVERLKPGMGELMEIRTEVQHSVDAARGRGEVIKGTVLAWLERVDGLETDVTTLLDDAAQENTGCLRGGCSVRYRVSHEANEKIILAGKLQIVGKFTAVSDPAPPPGIELMTTSGFEPFESTKIGMNEIRGALKDENINLVGVYGMGGVGKTILATELGKALKREGIFDEVVMATVSQHPVLRKIQGEIAENLGLRFMEESEPLRGRRLSERLKQHKRILIILDDLWAPLELADLGIPSRDQMSKRCNVVLTSLEVCSQMMTQAEIEVRVLTERDAWSLFRKNAGDCVDSSELHTVSREVSRECGGLPIALVTLGRALRNKDRTVWVNAARQLKRSIAKDIAGMHEKVFSSIRLSYDFLESKETKFCFLLCCLFCEDCKISKDALLPYVFGERVFGYAESLMEVRDRLHAVLDKLKALCLLFNAEDGYVKMHDVVRDVAIAIAREDHGFEVKAGRGLRQWLEIENPERCKRLSLMQNEITKLSKSPDCFQLLTLTLRENGPLKEISDGFFEGMTLLTTLDLSFTSICLLPSSISCLTNLRVLDLGRDASTGQSRQPAMDISLLGNLKKLEILDLKNCNVWCFPEEMVGLIKLKILNLSRNERLTIPLNVLSQFSLLEELDLSCSFDNWQVEGKDHAHFSEVASLTGLTNLRLDIMNVKCLSACVPIYSQNLTQFSITIGDREIVDANGFVSHYDTAIYFGRVEPKELSSWFKMLMGRTQFICFSECKGLGNLLQLSIKVFGGLNNLKALVFDNCDDVRYLFDADLENPPEVGSNRLEHLTLYCLENLEAICHGSLPDGYLNKLAFLHVSNCNNLLINVLHLALITRVSNLEDLKVEECCGLTEIFNSTGLKGEDAVLTKLQTLDLSHLPQLVTVWKGVIPSGSLQNIRWVRIQVSNNLQYVFSPAMVENLQQLERLEIAFCNEMEQIISVHKDDEEQQAGVGPTEKNCRATTSSQSDLSNLPSIPIFCKLRFLRILRCPKLQHFLPLSLAEGLLQLEDIEISDCEDLKEIFAVEGETDHEEKVTLPKSNTLNLEKLPNILGVIAFSLSQGDDLLLDFPSLDRLNIEQCENLKSFHLYTQNPPPTDITGDWIGLEEIKKQW